MLWGRRSRSWTVEEPRNVLQTVNKTIPVQVWNMRLREFGIVHQEVIAACMELRMNWFIFPIVSKNFSAWWWQLFWHDSYHVVLGQSETKPAFRYTRTYVENWHREALSRHHGTVTGAARGGCLRSLCSVRRLDLGSCDILSHGCCYREWADQTEETSTGAAFRPTLDQPTEEESQ